MNLNKPPFHKVYGTTARSGGWRKGIKTPARVAPDIIDLLRTGQTVAIVFGPEDKGLTNAETEICSSLLTIPTTDDSSLNLSHAVLVTLYECFKQALEQDFQPQRGNRQASPVTQAEYALLFTTIQEALEGIDFLKAGTSSYFMLPVRHYLNRFRWVSMSSRWLPVLAALWATPRTTWSKSAVARATTSMCPRVIGSKLPGYTAKLMGVTLTAPSRQVRDARRDRTRRRSTLPDPGPVRGRAGPRPRPARVDRAAWGGSTDAGPRPRRA